MLAGLLRKSILWHMNGDEWQSMLFLGHFDMFESKEKKASVMRLLVLTLSPIIVKIVEIRESDHCWQIGQKSSLIVVPEFHVWIILASVNTYS